METLHPKARKDPFGSKINRAHSPILAYGIPWLSILLGSLTPWLPVIAPAPVLPPLGFMMLLAWRLLRPGLLPLWASLALFAIELIEIRFPWRNFWLDWITASAIMIVYLAVAAVLAGAPFTLVQLTVILPQLLLSIVLFPMIARLVAQLDRLRLMRVRRLG